MSDAIKERYAATLVGCATGDTLGMAVEGWPKERIRKHIGRITAPIEPVIIRDSSGKKLLEDELGRILYIGEGLTQGDYTDDTILTLALAKSIAMLEKIDIEHIGREHLAAYDAQPKASNRMALGGFGGTTVKALMNIRGGVSPYNSGITGSPGNAPPMKMAPVGIYMHATGKIEEGLKDAEAIGKITHLDPRSVAGGVVQARAVCDLLNGTTREAFINTLISTAVAYEKEPTPQFNLWEKGTLTQRLRWIKENMDAEAELAYGYLGNSGLVFESYPFALFMFQKHWDSPLEGLLETVNYGGDCDTTGAMFGTLSGARHGMWFPHRWLNVIKGLEPLVAAAEKIYEIGRGRQIE